MGYPNFANHGWGESTCHFVTPTLWILVGAWHLRIANISLYPQERSVSFNCELLAFSCATMGSNRSVAGSNHGIQHVRYLQGFLKVIQTFRLGDSVVGSIQPVKVVIWGNPTHRGRHRFEHTDLHTHHIISGCARRSLDYIIIGGEKYSWINFWSCIKKGNWDRWWV